jgi:transcriptional regulator with XRE-family HTH domain
MLVQVLDAATPTLRDIAREAGISYHAIRRYREGARTPHPAVLRKLALALRARGGKLAQWAKALEAAAGRREPPGRGRSS